VVNVMGDNMKIVLLVFLILFALEDMRVRSIPVDMLILYMGLFMLKCIFTRSVLDFSMVAGVLPGMLCLVMAIVSKEKIGLGDAAMIGIMGITIGGEDTLWIWWISSIIALMFCLIKGLIHNKYRRTGKANEKMEEDGEEYVESKGSAYGRSSGNNTFGADYNADTNRRSYTII